MGKIYLQIRCLKKNSLLMKTDFIVMTQEKGRLTILYAFPIIMALPALDT